MKRFNHCRTPKELDWRSRQKSKIERLARDCAKADDDDIVREQRLVDALPTRNRYEE